MYDDPRYLEAGVGSGQYSPPPASLNKGQQKPKKASISLALPAEPLDSLVKPTTTTTASSANQGTSKPSITIPSEPQQHQPQTQPQLQPQTRIQTQAQVQSVIPPSQPSPPQPPEAPKPQPAQVPMLKSLIDSCSATAVDSTSSTHDLSSEPPASTSQCTVHGLLERDLQLLLAARGLDTSGSLTELKARLEASLQPGPQATVIELPLTIPVPHESQTYIEDLSPLIHNGEVYVVQVLPQLQISHYLARQQGLGGFTILSTSNYEFLPYKQPKTELKVALLELKVLKNSQLHLVLEIELPDSKILDHAWVIFDLDSSSWRLVDITPSPAGTWASGLHPTQGLLTWDSKTRQLKQSRANAQGGPVQRMAFITSGAAVPQGQWMFAGIFQECLTIVVAVSETGAVRTFQLSSETLAWSELATHGFPPPASAADLDNQRAVSIGDSLWIYVEGESPAAGREAYVLDGITLRWTKHNLSRRVAFPTTDTHLCGSDGTLCIMGGSAAPQQSAATANDDSYSHESMIFLSFLAMRECMRPASCFNAPSNVDIFAGLQRHYNNPTFADVTLQLPSGARMPAHRLVLAANAPVLEAALAKASSSSSGSSSAADTVASSAAATASTDSWGLGLLGALTRQAVAAVAPGAAATSAAPAAAAPKLAPIVIKMTETDDATAMALVQYMYGCLQPGQLSPGMFQQLLYAAVQYQVHGLVDLCCHELTHSLDMGRLPEVLATADELALPQVYQACVAYSQAEPSRLGAVLGSAWLRQWMGSEGEQGELARRFIKDLTLTTATGAAAAAGQ